MLFNEVTGTYILLLLSSSCRHKFRYDRNFENELHTSKRNAGSLLELQLAIFNVIIAITIAFVVEV